MHHKFSITDDEEVLTGSYNWTRSAEQYNQENLVVIKNDLIATCYKDEFEKLWKNLMDY
jgi:phosphatidylserine/phosphatidylglycerophosphate/cardiolipin synthase-like enzyme